MTRRLRDLLSARSRPSALLLALPLLLAPRAGAAPEPGAAAIVTSFQDAHLVLDWTVPGTRGPATFRISTRDGRFVAHRQARRSVQGWIASLRVAGWPPGVYRVEAEAEGGRSSTLVALP